MLTYTLILIFICLSFGLVFFLLKNNKGEKEPISALWIAAGFGLIGALAAVVIEKELIPLHNLLAGSRFSVMLPSFLAVGVIEETLKFLPLAIFIYPKKYFNKHIDGIIYFAIAGLGFGLPENILYTLDYGSKAGLNRLILTPFFHAAITGMVGYFLIKAKLSKKNPLSIWPVLVFAVLVHSLYDFGLSSGTNLFTFISITITLALSTNCLNLFLKAKDLDEDAGLVAVGHNSYCRSCGHNNKAHHLYCTSCGNRA